MKTTWLTRDAVLQLTGWTTRTVERKVKNGVLESRLSSKAQNGKSIREFALRSLPHDAQKKALNAQLVAAFSPENAPAKVTPIDSPQGQLAFPDSSTRLEAYRDLTILSPDQDKEAQRRFAAVDALQQIMQRGRDKDRMWRPLSGVVLSTNLELENYIAKQHNMSRQTLLMWRKRLNERGYSALAGRTPGPAKGFSDFFDNRPELRSFAEKKYLSERLSIRMVHEALETECARRSIDPPCYETVRLYLSRQPEALKIIAREGEREYHDRCEMYVVKDYRAKIANDIWVSDHMTHDVFVRNDGFFPDEKEGAPLRPWLTAIIDYRTRKVLGWTWSANPSSDSINSAMRMALIHFGKPAECLYVDNGKDYKSLGRVNPISPQLSGALQRLEIASQHCQPRHPQSKHIERWFRTLHERFDVLWRPFYSGTSPKDRPEECDQQLAEHNKLLKAGQVEQSPLPLASEFVQAAALWITEYNAKHRHTGEGMDGKTPDELFNQQYPIGNRRLLKQEDIRALDELLRRRERRRVREGGCIFIHNHRYEPSDAASNAAMFHEIEHDVIVACDPANMGEAIACDLDGRYLATLQASKLLAHGPVSRDEVRASLRKRHLVRRALTDHVQNLIAASYARGERSELEHLRERAGLDGPIRVQRRRGVRAMQLPAVAAAPAAQVGYDHVADRFFEEAD
jgi:putative transposase